MFAESLIEAVENERILLLKRFMFHLLKIKKINKHQLKNLTFLIGILLAIIIVGLSIVMPI